MKKCLATLLFAVLLAFPAAAQGTGDAVVMTSQGDRATVTVTLPQNEASGVTSLSLSFDVQKGTEGSVQFDFSDTLQSSVQQYCYNAETGRLTVYLSGTKPIFTDGSATLGTIRLDSAKSAAASVRVGEDSLKLVNAAFGSTAAQITEQSVDLAVTVDDVTPESPSEPETPVLPEDVYKRQLPDGEYTVTVTGTGFVPYRQTLSVRGLMYSLQMYTGRLAAQTYGAAHPGVLLAGDTDGSGAVDQTDVSAMLAAIESGTQADARFDLDGSGAVDLLDLQILTTGLEAAGQTLSTVCELVPAGLTSVSADQGNTAVAQGDLEAFLAGESSVQLTPSAGAEISEANPVELSFDFGRTEDDAVAMAGMTLQTPAGSVNEVTPVSYTHLCIG